MEEKKKIAKKNKIKEETEKKFSFNRNHIVLVIVILAIIGAIVYLESQKADITGNVVGTGIKTSDLKDGNPRAPELVGIVEYLNTNGESINIRELEGKVVLIDFWTYTCVNCIRTLPYLTEWDEKYRDKGLVIIGVHTPEFEFEKKTENVQNAIKKYGIKYPVVLDNNYGTWRAYGNQYWPRKYLIDSEGYVRYDHIGEGAYEETEKVIQELLAESGSDVSGMELTEEIPFQRIETTPELYAGYNFALPRNQNLGNPSGFVPDKTGQYIISTGEIEPHKIYLQGLWRNNPDNLELIGNNGTIILGFAAKETNIVASPGTKSMTIDVTINGAYLTEEQAGIDIKFSGKRSYVLIDSPRMYNIFSGEPGGYILGIGAREGFSFNAFTFG